MTVTIETIKKNYLLWSLREVKNIISDEKSWTKETAARNAEGNKVHPYNYDAICFCTIGAIQRARLSDSSFEVFGELQKSIIELYSEYENIEKKSVVQFFNDSKNTTHEMLMSVFDHAITRVKEQ